MSAGVTCAKCGARIDEHAFETKRRLHAKLYPDKPFEPPKICSECLWANLCEFAGLETP